MENNPYGFIQTSKKMILLNREVNKEDSDEKEI